MMGEKRQGALSNGSEWLPIVRNRRPATHPHRGNHSTPTFSRTMSETMHVDIPLLLNIISDVNKFRKCMTGIIRHNIVF